MFVLANVSPIKLLDFCEQIGELLYDENTNRLLIPLHVERFLPEYRDAAGDPSYRHYDRYFGASNHGVNRAGMARLAQMADPSVDRTYMERALDLARRAEAEGEVPVGAIVVRDEMILGEGWNQPIGANDPTAHAEIVALRDAAQCVGNYRLPGATLYVTLEPCPMCAGAMVHARISRLVFAAWDPRSGAAGSVFNLLPTDQRFNHQLEVEGGLLAAASSQLLREFFRARR